MRNQLASVFLGLALGLCAASSGAITLSVEPATRSVELGTQASVSIVISGLGAGISPSLGVFDIDMSFDSARLGFSSVVFGPFLGDTTLGEAATSFDGTTTPGIVNLFELSLLEANAATCIVCLPPFLDDLQPATFTLATLTFDTLIEGTSGIGLPRFTLGDGNGDNLAADAQGGQVSIVRNPKSVPEPGVLALLGIGLMGAMLSRRRSY